MANPWFKFYGGEYLADPKIKSMTSCQRQCWTVLMAYASISECEGMIKHLTEKQLMLDAGIDPFKSEWQETVGVLQIFSSPEKNMISIDDNGLITLNNWNKKQEKTLTGYERIKRYRMKNDNGYVTNDNDDNKHDNDRIEENRIEENRIDKKREGENLSSSPNKLSKSFFSRTPEEVETFVTAVVEKTKADPKWIAKEVKAFMGYWTERNKSGTKQKWELEKTFEVDRRFSKWLNNSQKWSKGSQSQIKNKYQVEI